jgi:hypothetical protein
MASMKPNTMPTAAIVANRSKAISEMKESIAVSAPEFRRWHDASCRNRRAKC